MNFPLPNFGHYEATGAQIRGFSAFDEIADPAASAVRDLIARLEPKEGASSVDPDLWSSVLLVESWRMVFTEVVAGTNFTISAIFEGDSANATSTAFVTNYDTYVASALSLFAGESSNSAILVSQPPSSLARSLTLLRSRRGILQAPQFEGLDRQIRALLADDEDLSELGITASIGSLDNLIEFLTLDQARQHPNLSISRQGLFAASWSPGRRCKLTLTFDSSGGGGEWVGINLDVTPILRGSGRFQSSDDIPPQFKGWMAP